MDGGFPELKGWIFPRYFFNTTELPYFIGPQSVICLDIPVPVTGIAGFRRRGHPFFIKKILIKIFKNPRVINRCIKKLNI
jgi:hypothetical protein